jgi:fluoride exporter
MKEKTQKSFKIRLLDCIGVMIGGGIGGVARIALIFLLKKSFMDPFPFAIYIVNAFGCLVLGFLLAYYAKRLKFFGEVTMYVGLLAGFSTFSDFCLNSAELIIRGHISWSILLLLSTIFAGIGLFFMGYNLGENMRKKLEHAKRSR